MKKITSLLILLISISLYGQSPIYSENFSRIVIPTDWHSSASGSSTLSWTFGSSDMPTGTDFASNAAILTDNNNTGGDVVRLYSDDLDLSKHNNITLSFKYAIQAFNSDGKLELYLKRKASLGGIKRVITYDADTNPTDTTIDISAFVAANASSFDLEHMAIYFVWDDEGATSTWGAGVNNIVIDGTPKNDDCANAINITNLATNSFNYSQNMGGTTNNGGFVTNCGAGVNDGVWFKFTAPLNGEIYLSERCNDFDSEIAVYTGTCGSFTCVDSSDSALSGGYETMTIDVSANTTYYINIGQYSSTIENEESGDMRLLVKYAPRNDIYTHAINIPLTTSCASITASNVGATNSGGNIPTCAVYNGGDVWYSFEAPAYGAIKISRPSIGDWGTFGYAVYTDNATIPTFDPILCGFINSNNLNEDKYIYNLVPGQTYKLRVWEYNNNDFGTIEFCVAAIENDGNGRGFEVMVQPENASSYVETYASNVNATDSPNASPTCGGYSGGDVWFKFTTPTNGNDVAVIHSNTQGDWSSFSFAIYSNHTSDTYIHCNTIYVEGNASGPYDERIITGLAQGTEYYLRAWDWGNNDSGVSAFYLREDSTSGVEDYTSLDFNYYPNPATNLLNVSAKDDITAITLTNMMGQQVITLSPNSQEVKLNIAHLPQGIYMMNVMMDDKSKTVKIIKK